MAWPSKSKIAAIRKKLRAQYDREVGVPRDSSDRNDKRDLVQRSLDEWIADEKQSHPRGPSSRTGKRSRSRKTQDFRQNPTSALPIGKKVRVYAKRLRNGKIELYR
jgi:hypothetical protein